MQREHEQDDMVAVPAGRLAMGCVDRHPEERPVRSVELGPFRLDRHPVTNRQFARFVDETGYVTVAELALAGADYPDIAADRLQPGALVFTPRRGDAAPQGPYDWWQYVPGACWLRPEGGRTVQAGRIDHPVTCVAHDDAPTRDRRGSAFHPKPNGSGRRVAGWLGRAMPGATSSCRAASAWPILGSGIFLLSMRSANGLIAPPGSARIRPMITACST